MEPHHEPGFPATFCRWVGEIVQSSPEIARLTLAELIVGALLASGGHVTQAILALTPRLGWQAYHWMLERGRFRLLGLIAALCRIVQREIWSMRRLRHASGFSRLSACCPKPAENRDLYAPPVPRQTPWLPERSANPASSGT